MRVDPRHDSRGRPVITEKLEHVLATDVTWAIGRAGVTFTNPESGVGIMLHGRADALATLQAIVSTPEQARAREAAQQQLDKVRELHEPVTVAVGRFESVQGDPVPADAKLEARCRTCNTVFPCDTAREVYTENEIEALLKEPANV